MISKHRCHESGKPSLFRPSLYVLLLVLPLLSTLPASAALIVDVQDAAVTAGGSGTVNVLISSTGADTVDLANYVFGITNVGSPASTLEFANPQTLTENLEANYLFAADLDPLGLDIFSLAAAELEGGDLTDSGGGISVSGTPFLLATLDLQSQLGPGQTAAMAAGEQFRITLQNVGQTFFDDDFGDPVAIDASSFAVAGLGGGTVTLTSAAVPEPSSFLMFAALGAVGWVVRRRRQVR